MPRTEDKKAGRPCLTFMFPCPHCSKIYTYESGRVRHIEKKHKRKPRAKP